MTVEAPKKVLLFISHQPDAIKVAGSFLSKRNFSVHVEAEIKDALVQIFEIKPDFIFIAWDHPDKKVTLLPKILANSTASIVVPFINKNTKDSIFKIDQCPYTPKLYPPLSGPSVERLILKATKEDADYLEKVNKFKTKTAKHDEIMAIQKNLADTALAEIGDTEESPPEADASDLLEQNLPDDESNLNGSLSEIEKRNALLDEEKAPLTEDQIKGLRETLDEKVKPSLENVLSAQDSAGAKKEKAKQKNTLIFQTGPVSTFIDKGPIIQKGISRTTGNFNRVKKPKDLAPVSEEPLVESEVVESYNVYCISIISASWCGYFVVSSLTSLDFNTIDLVFTDWIKAQLRNLDDITERDYFDFENVSPESIKEIQKIADYSEEMNAYDRDFNVSFFAVEPKDMKIDFSPDKNFIQVYTRDIPPQAALDFDLLLHLPENKKYLLFTMKAMAITEDQRSRLLSRNVTQLFTSIENEREFRRFLVRKTFSRLHEIINNKLSGL